MKEIFLVEKFKGKTYCVEFYDGEKIYLNAEFIAEYSLKSGVKIPEEALEEIVYQNDFKRAKERAFYLLEYRDHSFKELKDKLLRNYSKEIAFEITEKMVELGFVDDVKYAKKYARQLFEVKKIGKFKAKFELQKKGIDKDIIENILEEYSNESDERIDALIEKKYARYLCDEKGYRKVYNALLRQGYSYDEVSRALKKIKNEVED